MRSAEAARVALVLGFATLVSAACSDSTGAGQDVVLDYRFATVDPAWRTGFADFPAAQEAGVGFIGTYQALPAGLSGGPLAAYLSGHNLSDDLIMFWTRPVTGLVPDQRYDVGISVEFATTYGQGCELGNAPSVWIKAGLLHEEPQRVLDAGGWYRLNIDHGDQSNPGATMPILGDIRNGQPGCSDTAPFALNQRATANAAFRIRASTDGGLWAFLGTESGFEGPHEIYFTRVRFTLRPVQ